MPECQSMAVTSLPFSLIALPDEFMSDVASSVNALVRIRDFRFPNIIDTPVLTIRGSVSTSRAWSTRWTTALRTDVAGSGGVPNRLASNDVRSDAKLACVFRGCLGILGLTERLRLSSSWLDKLLKARTGPWG